MQAWKNGLWGYACSRSKLNILGWIHMWHHRNCDVLLKSHGTTCVSLKKWIRFTTWHHYTIHSWEARNGVTERQPPMMAHASPAWNHFSTNTVELPRESSFIDGRMHYQWFPFDSISDYCRETVSYQICQKPLCEHTTTRGSTHNGSDVFLSS